MPTCLIGLGSNLGDRHKNIARALRSLEDHPRIESVLCSRLIDTRPAGGPVGQGEFLNGAAVLETSLAPDALLTLLHETERRSDRPRRVRWGPRPIDLDLLLYDQEVSDRSEITLPHPRMAWRRFVLEPAAEVAPRMIHPTTGWSIARLLKHLNVGPNYVALAGGSAAERTRLAQQLVATTCAYAISDPAPTLPGEITSGNAWQRQIESLDWRCRTLSTEQPRWSDSGKLWIGDFWFGQSLFDAKRCLSTEQYAMLEQRWKKASAKCIQPKLTVLLDDPTDEASPHWRTIMHPEAQLDLGPVLHIDRENRDRVVEEVVAAVTAMQPHA